MPEIQRINITLPKKLLNKTKILVDEGLYSNFSEMVRESLKNEIMMNIGLIEKKSSLEKWFKEEEGYDTSSLTQEEMIKKIRKTRDELWDKKYQEWFEGIEN